MQLHEPFIQIWFDGHLGIHAKRAEEYTWLSLHNPHLPWILKKPELQTQTPLTKSIYWLIPHPGMQICLLGM